MSVSSDMNLHRQQADFFFVPVPKFVAQSTLTAFQKKNHPWLELSDVHIETTENIRVTAIAFYMGYNEQQHTNRYWVSIKLTYASKYFIDIRLFFQKLRIF